MELLKIGTIADTFALDGSLKIFSSTSLANIRYKIGNKLLIVDNKDNVVKTLSVQSYKKSGSFDIVKFNEINTIDEASLLKGYEIKVEKNINDLEKGYYFYDDLVGCTIVSNNQPLGKVIKVEEFPAQITLRVSRENKPDFFVPFIKNFINNIDIDNKTIEINLVEGML